MGQGLGQEKVVHLNPTVGFVRSMVSGMPGQRVFNCITPDCEWTASTQLRQQLSGYTTRLYVMKNYLSRRCGCHGAHAAISWIEMDDVFRPWPCSIISTRFLIAITFWLLPKTTSWTCHLYLETGFVWLDNENPKNVMFVTLCVLRYLMGIFSRYVFDC